MATVQRITDQLEKPELDDRSYRVIRLANKLEALLVHDPDTDKASAAVNVNVGNFSDDGDMPGMAHAVEHLLFMGTQKVSPEPIVIDRFSDLRLLFFPPHFSCFPPGTLSNQVLCYCFLVVPKGECIQPIPRGTLRIVQCLHSGHRDQLLL